MIKVCLFCKILPNCCLKQIQYLFGISQKKNQEGANPSTLSPASCDLKYLDSGLQLHRTISVLICPFTREVEHLPMFSSSAYASSSPTFNVFFFFLVQFRHYLFPLDTCPLRDMQTAYIFLPQLAVCLSILLTVSFVEWIF